MKKRLKQLFVGLLRFGLALVLAFLGSAILWTVVTLPFLRNSARSRSGMTGAVGFAAGLLCFSLIARFRRLYVLGHEFTHWFTAKIFRRNTGRFEVSPKGGSVEIENPNVWIILAPYFVPVYTLIWIGMYGTLQFLSEVTGIIDPSVARNTCLKQVFLAGTGFSYAYHVVLTVYALRRQQQDLTHHGRIFSLSFIFFCNSALLLAGITVAERKWTETAALLWQNVGRGWYLLCLATERIAGWMPGGAAGY